MIRVLPVLLFFHILYAEPQVRPDSARTFPMKEVVVTATGSPVAIGSSPSRVTQLSRESIEMMNGSSLGLILRDAPGVFVREYGAGGALQTVSFRGMAGEQTLVLLDGATINNVQLGLADLRLVPVDQIERIELVRGGGSSLYGANAVGGVINIMTNTASRRSETVLDASIGSFGTSRIGVRSSYAPSQDVQLTLGSSTETGSGNYPFSLLQQGVAVDAVRSNVDYRGYDAYIKSDWLPSAKKHAHLLLSYQSLDRGTPGPFLTASSQRLARQADDDLLAVGSVSSDITGRVQFSASAGFHDTYEHYADFLGVFPADNFYRNILSTLTSRFRYEIAERSAITAGVEVGRADANGNALDGEKTQTHEGVFLASEISPDSIASQMIASLFPSVRYDYFAGVDDAWSPKLGLNLRFPGTGPDGNFSFSLHSTLGRDFRPPTFNELYYAGAGGRGNPALVPERSVSFDLGLTIEYPLAGVQDFDATYYSITTRDRILWQPASSQFDWRPVNVGKTVSRGLEIEYRWTLPGGWLEFGGNYALLDARKKFSSGAGDPTYDKQLVYVPLETGDIGATIGLPVHDYMLRRLRMRIAGEYVGDRYTVEDNSVAVPGYFLLNCKLGLDLQITDDLGMQIRYEVGNLTNESYEVIPRYPMPLRNHSLSFSITKTYGGENR
ncbi:MAG TPA: TonB-dependent receptor [Bacteroidota bacterium]|nr:TonB-dependent receptor [Bacteroidota bacterium]